MCFFLHSEPEIPNIVEGETAENNQNAPAEPPTEGEGTAAPGSPGADSKGSPKGGIHE